MYHHCFLHFCVLFCLSFIPFSSHSQTKGNARLLEELDKTLRERQKNRDERSAVINELKDQYSKAKTDSVRIQRCKDIVYIYSYVQTDSALVYIKKQKQAAKQMKNHRQIIEADILRAHIYIMKGMYVSAKESLDAIKEQELSKELLLLLNNEYRTYYYTLANYTTVPEVKRKYYEKTMIYRQYVLSNSNPSFIDYDYITINKYIEKKEYENAIRYNKECLRKTTDYRKKGRLQYSLYTIYKILKETDLQETYLISACISDQKGGVREYIALRELAAFLHKRGDVDRAYTYVLHALQDAIMSKARLRAIEVSELLPVIEKAYKQQKEKETRTTITYLSAVSILALLLLTLFFFILKQLKILKEARLELKDANEQLQQSNKMLQEVVQVKEEYLAQYLNQCSLYIDKLDIYRRQLAKLAMTSKLEELFHAIKSDSFIEKEIKDFYKQFDTTFLKLYPDFVQSFNALLQEEAQITPKKGSLLTTELRIFALIRLGIEDSKQIASFLRYSILTVYNYRSKIRKHARGDKQEFEKALMQIGEVV